MQKKVFIGISLLLIGILYLKVFIPIFNIHIPCVFNVVTGFECPGCGMTRATLALLEGNLYQAFRWNMLIFILIPLYCAYILLSKTDKYAKQSRALMVTMLTLSVLFFILRNTETFSWLAPTYVG